MRRLFEKVSVVRAIDTNIVVRVITNDDPDQVSRALTVLNQGNIFMALTVCLETERVLRTAYGLSKDVIAVGLSKFAGIEGIELENPEALDQAITWMRQGMDFADAIHLASSDGCDMMYSFDARLAKSAARAGAMPVIAP